MNIADKKSNEIREATLIEALYTIHTLWTKLLLSKSMITIMLKNVYDVDLIEISKSKITVKSTDGLMTQSLIA